MAWVYAIKVYISPTARPRWRVVHSLPATRANAHILHVYLRWLADLHPDKRYKLEHCFINDWGCLAKIHYYEEVIDVIVILIIL
jgi:hypothetical protein